MLVGLVHPGIVGSATHGGSVTVAGGTVLGVVVGTVEVLDVVGLKEAGLDA